MGLNVDGNALIKDLWRYFESKDIDPGKIEPGTLRDLWQALYAARRFIDFVRSRGALDASMQQEVQEFEKLYSAVIKQTTPSSIIGQ